MKSILLPILMIICSTGLGIDKKKQPNILFAIADDWSFGHAGAYGCEWIKTPAFDRVAREGILFNRAYTPNAKCAPSRAIILTGRNSWQLEEAANHQNIFPAKFKGWMEVLTENGYSTGFTGKGWGPGIAKNHRGIDRLLTGTVYNREKLIPPGKGISNNDYTANFISFLKESPRGNPWAFWFGTTEPHRGYENGIGQRMGKKLSDIESVPKFWPDNEIVRSDMLDYAIEVEHYDNHLGQILETLDKV
ncbi:MAG: sulfatase-like hydrolase/transferase, partial [Opitutae bacterium]|nr:sulfatase-like hydrolase/transferase [Opitutae bacterium]